MAENIAGTVYLRDYKPPVYAIERIDLEFDLDPDRTVVRNRMRIRRSASASSHEPLRLDGIGLELLRLRLNGETLGSNRLEIKDDGLTIDAVPEAFDLEIETAISPRKNSSRSGLIELGGKLATQCEAEGFRKLTYFPDRPDVLARYRVTLRGDRSKYPHLLSNGDLVAAGTQPDGRHFAVWDDPHPKPCYIFAVMAGDWGVLRDEFVTRSGRRVALSIYADRELVDKCRFAMDVVKRALRWDEERYGLEYDLDVFSIVALTGWSGAMENKGLNLFDAHGIVADPEIATDDDYIIIERIIGHELFHNWTGNRVTCRDWFQLCLKEGLTRFRDQHFIEDKMASGVWRIEIVKALRRNQFPEDEGPAAHPIQPDAYAEIDNFYTNTVYDKGAEIVRMLRTLLGPEGYRAGFDRYIAENDGRAATVEDFISAMEKAAGRDLAQFRNWYHQAGRPTVTARGAYDAMRRIYSLTLTQSCAPTPGQPTKPPFHIPVVAGLHSTEGKPLPFRFAGVSSQSAVLDLKAARQEFVFEEVSEPPIPSLLRGFSAPVTLDAGLSDSELAALMGADSDAFARWDASQTLAVRLIRSLAAKRAKGEAMAAPEPFLAAMGQIVSDEASDRLARSQILALPDEPVLSEGLPVIDLDGHMAARNFLRRAIASRHRTALFDCYQRNRETGDYLPDMAGIGRRRLRNAALDLLMSLEEPEISVLCLTQLKEAQNMTDMFEALCMLTHVDCPHRREGIDWFYARWRDNSTVIDKWFNAQALSRMPGVIDEIVALEKHPDFDINNFARGMLFYGGFFRQNRVAFHDRSGKGYEFLADRLLMIDRLGRSGSHYIMPQINQWRRYDPVRQALMRRALERVANTEGISKGLRENVARALQ